MLTARRRLQVPSNTCLIFSFLSICEEYRCRNHVLELLSQQILYQDFLFGLKLQKLENQTNERRGSLAICHTSNSTKIYGFIYY